MIIKHEVKSLPKFYQDAIDGKKPFTIRINDRNYMVGHTLIKREWSLETGYTGREASFTITDISDWGQPTGQVVMGIKLQGSKEVMPITWSESTHLFECTRCGTSLEV